MNNGGKVILGTVVAAGVVALISRSAKGAVAPPLPPVQTPTYTLTVNNSPSLGGGVSGAGVNYVSQVIADTGTVITLTASPHQDYSFDHWSGDATGTNPVLSVTMNSNKAITANFKYTPPPTVPTVSTDPADNITHTEADLHGKVISLGSASSVNLAFLFGETINYEMAPSPTQQITSAYINFPIAFSSHVTDLVPGKTYHYKVIATSADGHTVYGQDQTFTAAAITNTNGFTLRAVNPGVNDTIFEWQPAPSGNTWPLDPFDPAVEPYIYYQPITQTITFPVFVPGGSNITVSVGHGTLINGGVGGVINGGFNYRAGPFPISNLGNYVFDCSTRTLRLA